MTKVWATDGRSLMVREVSCVDKVLIHQIQTEDALNRTCAHASIEGESMSILTYKTCSFCPRSQDPTVDLKAVTTICTPCVCVCGRIYVQQRNIDFIDVLWVFGRFRFLCVLLCACQDCGPIGRNESLAAGKDKSLG